MTYCTVAEVFERLAFEEPATGDLLKRVTDAVTSATTTIDNDCHRTFTAVDSEARTFGGGRPNGFEITIPDLRTIESLKLDDDGDGVFETTVTDFELDKPTSDAAWPYETLRLLGRQFPTSGRRRIRVEITGTWGWASIPAPINQACSLLAAQIAQRTSAALFGIQSFGELSSQGIEAHDPTYEMLVHDYRRIGIA
jgi:hypothetical protein